MSEEGEKEIKDMSEGTSLKDKTNDEGKYETFQNYAKSYNLTQIIQEGLIEIGQKRPQDPVRYLGEYLVKRAENK